MVAEDLEREFQLLMDTKDFELIEPETKTDLKKAEDFALKVSGLIYNELDEVGKCKFWSNGTLSWDECKLASRFIQKEYMRLNKEKDPEPLVVILPSKDIGSYRILGLSEETDSTCNEITLALLKTNSNNEVYTEYLDNISGLRQIVKDLSWKGYIYRGIDHAGNTVKIFYEKELNNGKRYSIVGVKVPFLNQLRNKNARKSVTIKEPFILVREAKEISIPLSEVQEYPKRVEDINSLLPTPAWSDLEKEIVLSNVLHFQERSPTGNLVIDAGSRTFKTTTLLFLSKMLGDIVHECGQVTWKGLGLSYTTSGVPCGGLLFEANYVCLANEFFDVLDRLKSKHTDQGEIIEACLKQIKEILEHMPINPRAGGQSQSDKKGLMMRTPLIASTNKLDDNLRNVLSKRLEILNRFQFMCLSNDTLDKINSFKKEGNLELQDIAVDEMVKKCPFSPEEFQRLTEVLRKTPVKFDKMKVVTISNSLKEKLPPTLKDWNIEEVAYFYAQALSKVDILLNEDVIPSEIIPLERVYDRLDEILTRLANDLDDLFE